MSEARLMERMASLEARTDNHDLVFERLLPQVDTIQRTLWFGLGGLYMLVFVIGIAEFVYANREHNDFDRIHHPNTVATTNLAAPNGAAMVLIP